MINYKGYLIESGSSQVEETYYDGHRNEGTGKYTINHYIRIIDPILVKTMIVQSEDEAKSIIDNFYSDDSPLKIQAIEEEIANIENKLAELRVESDNWVKEKVRLQEKLPPKFY